MIIRGRPTAAEVAAVIVVLAARPPVRPAEPPSSPSVSAWADRRRALAAPPSPGPNAWRNSARP